MTSNIWHCLEEKYIHKQRTHGFKTYTLARSCKEICKEIADIVLKRSTYISKEHMILKKNYISS
jgi:hypothetical protein